MGSLDYKFCLILLYYLLKQFKKKIFSNHLQLFSSDGSELKTHTENLLLCLYFKNPENLYTTNLHRFSSSGSEFENKHRKPSMIFYYNRL
jgi:hypothetical protein